MQLLQEHCQELWPEFPPIPAGYYPAALSFLRIDDNTLLGCLGCVNYFYQGRRGRKIRVVTDGPNYVTHNILIIWDKNLHILSYRPIVDCVAQAIYGKSHRKGLNSIRLFAQGGELKFISSLTSCQERHEVWQCLGSMGPISDILKITRESLYIVYLQKIGEVFPGNQFEKNWLPAMREGKLWILYDLGKNIWLRVNERGELREIQQVSKYGKKLCGSAGPIEVGGRILALGHRILYQGKRRVYRHYLVELSDGGKIIRRSKPFAFAQAGIEFCLSMLAWGPRGILFTISLNDNEVRLLYLNDPLTIFSRE